MIKLNDRIIKCDYFPDGTLRLNSDIIEEEINNRLIHTITWHYENNEEMIIIMFLTKHIQNNSLSVINLKMPYLPNARMDRVKNKSEVFTLKYFAEFINSLKFANVEVLDPHSYVSEALIERLTIKSPEPYINKAIVDICSKSFEPIIAFYPDEGAMKRYSSDMGLEYTFGIKKRDWKTGKIEGLDIVGNVDKIKNGRVLIIDDICSYGGTFYHSAKKLRELGAKEIYLYVTHCENSIMQGEIPESGLIDKIYTTNSIFLPYLENNKTYYLQKGLAVSSLGSKNKEPATEIEVFNI